MIAVQVRKNKLLSPSSKYLPLHSVCENGSLVCTNLPCPVYEPWSPWSSCSVSCGGGQRIRTRLCQHSEGGPSCADTEQSESCDTPTCPGLTWNEHPQEQLRVARFFFFGLTFKIHGKVSNDARQGFFSSVSSVSLTSGVSVERMVTLERVQCHMWRRLVSAEQNGPSRARARWRSLCWAARATYRLQHQQLPAW